MKKIFIVLLLLGICLPAVAASWIEIDYKQYLMFEKIEGSSIYYWIKQLNNGTFPKENKQTPAYYMGHYVSDCANNQYKNLAFYIYSSSGSVLSSQDYPDYSWRTPIPQSNAENWHQSACRAVSK